MYGVWLSSVAIGLCLIIGCGSQATEPDDERPRSGPTSTQHPQQSDNATDIAVQKLCQQEWNPEAAQAVASHNCRYLQLLYEEDRKQFDGTIAFLGRLGTHKYAQSRLAELPEVAGLLAGVLEYDKNGPELILQTISRDRQQQTLVLSLYGLSAMPSDSLALAKALTAERDLILELFKRDALDGLGWLTAFPPENQIDKVTDREAARIYTEWVRSVFNDAFRAVDSGEELDRARTLLMIHASAIQHKLKGDEEFRRGFLAEYWPTYRSILADQPDELEWAVYVGEPRVWGFLQQFGGRGEKLYRSYGPVAVELLLAEEFINCRPQVLTALAQADELMLQALFEEELRKEHLFPKLLRRNLPNGVLAKALHDLATRPAAVPQLLAYWDTLSDDALAAELGPTPDGVQTWIPGYSIYYLGKKVSQGREVTAFDAIWATVDAAEIVFMARGASKGLKAIQQGVKSGLRKRGFKNTAEKATRMTARELYPFTLREAYTACRKIFQAISAGTKFDVTQAVRFVYESSGVGRKTFKALTGLEARVFMRADRRVVFDLGDLVQQHHLLGRLLRETAANAGVELTVESPPGQAVVETVVTWGSNAQDLTDAQLKAWREHISAWWLAANDGSLAALADSIVANRKSAE